MTFLPQSRLVLLASLLLVLLPGCRKRASYKLRVRPKRTVSAQQQLVPLVAPKGIDKLDLHNFDSATVVIPIGARWARPVVIAIHGQNDSPEASCEAWATITEHTYFVLCPALRAAPAVAANSSTSECVSVDCLADEMREAMVVMRRRFGRYVARHEVMLAGYGTGAGRVVPIAIQNPTVFSVLWLVNGGLKQWATAFSTSYAERGGKLLGVVCSDASCEADTLRVQVSAQAVGLKTALVKPGQLGINWDVRVIEATRMAWRNSKPKGWPWSVPGQAEHIASQP